MGDLSGLKLSRRALIAGALVAPVANSAATSSMVTIRLSEPSDPVIAKAAAWIAADAAIDAMTLEWQDLESQLFDKAAALRIKTEKACRSRLPEARAMRALDRKIRAGYRDLALSAGEISLLRSISVAGALAKIELGLRVQGPYDWQDHALELAEGGIAELRALTTSKQELRGSR
jgi:hypothetical protein